MAAGDVDDALAAVDRLERSKLKGKKTRRKRGGRKKRRRRRRRRKKTHQSLARALREFVPA